MTKQTTSLADTLATDKRLARIRAHKLTPGMVDTLARLAGRDEETQVFLPLAAVRGLRSRGLLQPIPPLKDERFVRPELTEVGRAACADLFPEGPAEPAAEGE